MVRLLWAGRPSPQGGSSIPGSEQASLFGQLEHRIPWFPPREGLTGFSFSTWLRGPQWRGGRQRERSPAHRGTVLFSGRLWERKLGGLLRLWNYAPHKTTMQRRATERARTDKGLADTGRGFWSARCSAWAPPEELWQSLETLVSRGDRTPPPQPPTQKSFVAFS